MFSFLKKAFSQLSKIIETGISSIFKREKIDPETLNELEKLLLNSDFGGKTTTSIIEEIKKKIKNNPDLKGEDAKEVLKKQLHTFLTTEKKFDFDADVFVMLGINGSGKTTTAIKLAYKFKKKGEKVLLIAADTFRAAAKEQLILQAQKYAIDYFSLPEVTDPAAVVFQGCQHALNNGFTKIIIDTAGRLQSKKNLMIELEKVTRVIKKLLQEKTIVFLLTIDSVLGQNSLDQAKIFNEAVTLDGIILTKCDAQTKGGVVFSIVSELQVPLSYVTYGEDVQAIEAFDKNEFINKIIS